MPILPTLLGAVIILVALRDVFHNLFHPSGSGGLSRALMRVVWRMFRWAARGHAERLILAGPVAMVVIIASWVVLLATGWALVLWPYLPAEFLFASGLDPANQGGFLDALYLSLVTLGTLGYGDITPTNTWLRLLGPVEALVGFGLLTVVISWVLSVYPVLSRRRSLAKEVTLMREAERETGVNVLDLGPGTAASLLAQFTSRVTTVRGDLVQYPITYYFQTADRRSALSLAAPSLLRLADDAGAPGCPPEVQLCGNMLRGALDDLADELGQHCGTPPGTPLETAFRLYAADHIFSV